MICQEILSSSLTCQSVNTAKGRMQYLSLPYHFSDGACLSAYVIEQENGYLVSDDGATIFKIMCNDIDLGDRRRWQPLKNIATRHGYELNDSGTLRKHYQRDEVSVIPRELLLMMAEFVSWEVSIHETGDYDLTLHSHVEELLTAIYKVKPETNKVVTGPHGAKYNFDFYVGDTYVDAFKPHPIATGAKLRKLHDLARLDNEMSFLMIIDDRFDEEKASGEMGIFSDIASATLLTSLETRAGGAVSISIN
jgi:hypothetical protein